MLLLKPGKNNFREIIDKAVKTLQDGGIVAYPTETFYGLGVKFDLEDSLQRLFELKKRPEEKGIPLIVGSREQLVFIAQHINKQAEKLMDRFWPGPLTLLLPARNTLSELITAGTGKVAVRMPGKSFALHLARAAHFPFTATSANPSGFPPAKDIETIIGYFKDRIDLLIDGGISQGKLPSTIADSTQDVLKIVREGAIKKELLFE